MTSEFTNKPIKVSNDDSWRFATGVPIAMSFCLLWRANTNAKTPSKDINKVDWVLWDIFFNLDTCTPDNRMEYKSASNVCTADRGRANGSSNNCGTPDNCFFQYCNSFSSSPLSSHVRCHKVKSAYCTLKGASGFSSPCR